MIEASVAHNMTGEVLARAELHPERAALILGHEGGGEERVSFAQLCERAGEIQRALVARGWRAGDRAVVMMPVGADLYALVLALASAGMIAVLIDPGMGPARVLWAARHSGARALFSVKALTRFRAVVPTLRRLEVFTADGPGGVCGALGARRGGGPPELASVEPGTRALVTFTSGSTGRPKGADRGHGVLRAQHEALYAHFPNHEYARPVDCTCFPVVVFHNLSSGTTSALPPVDLRSPAEFDPAEVAGYLRRHQVTSLSGAPAFMSNLCEHLVEVGETVPTIGRLMVGGGPVSRELARLVLEALPGCARDAWGVYGSTEAEPMTHIRLEEMLAHPIERPGFLVGRPVEEAELRLLGLGAGSPRERAALEDASVRDSSAPGEIIVAGDHIVPRYLDDPEADRRNKLYPEDGTIWHRTGDVGRWDASGALWLTGRVNDLVELGDRKLEPFELEQVVGEWAEVARCALVSVGRDDGSERAFLAVEPERWEQWDRLEVRLEAHLEEAGLAQVRPVRVAQMPVDRRHQTKLDRPTLRLFLGLYQYLLAR